MKLSEIKGERTLDVIADCIAPICSIAQDDEASKLFQKERLPEGVSAKEFALNRWKKSLPKLLKNHKDDMITLLATLAGVSKKKYKEDLNLVSFLNDCVELLTDEVFQQLFFSQKQTTQESASVSENTEA